MISCCFDLAIDYKCYETTSFFTRLPKNHDTWDKMHNQYSVTIRLQDNFGTTHPIKLKAFQNVFSYK